MAETRILVVEDDSASARLIEMTLKSLGYAVPAVVSSGEEAIKKAGEVHPDLVLMDIRLKGDMDGVQAAEEICARFNIPVVYLTAYADDDTLQRAKITEPYGYILKPFQKGELNTTIDIALYKHRMDSKLKEREQALEKLTAELKTNNEQLQREITERKRIEKTLQDNVENLRRVINTNADSMLIVDRSGIVRFVNPATESLFSRKAEDLLGRQVGFPAVVGETTELDIMQKGGKTATAEMRVVETEWEGESVYLASLRDITERKRAQRAQERLSQQLQARVSELETFSYGIAHDLRSPLVSIEGFSRLLRDDMLNHDAERIQEDIRLLESGVRKMQQFLNRTLEYSRAGQLIKRTRNVSFGKIVNEVITEFAEQVRSIGATVSLADKFPRVYADRTRIMEVLTNLLQNSIKYRDKTRPLAIEIGHRLSKGEVVFFVRDNGLGIDASEVEKAFTLFYRGTADGQGSGIGLAIVKKIIEAHGGRIWAESQSGKGTTMCFTLPQQSGTNKGDNNGKD